MFNWKIISVFAYITSFVNAQICSETQVDIEAKKYGQCIAKSNLFDSSRPLQDSVCSIVETEVFCANIFFNTCFSGEANKIGTSNYVDARIQNLIEKVGYDIIPLLMNCEEFNSFSNDYLLQVTGSNQCDYFDFKNVLVPESKSCDKQFLKEFEKSITQIPTIQNFKSSTCNLVEQLSEICTKTLTDACFTDEKAKNLRSIQNETVYSPTEKIVQGLDPSFSLQNSCPLISGSIFSPILNVRKKRSANPEGIALTNTLHYEL
ncbi:uncharacterized protein [Lepeophtheirus salmonis]|uniref:uncharacterized protein n=1 Tax=Lepeophtheirus salmonis TaxID=72036 RepID=UPI001AE46994|nr:uncharacterized protein LOC121130395 [Lepeophtheirus salmonis]